MKGPPEVVTSAQRLRQAWGERQPTIAVILGSGWSGVTQTLLDAVDVPYAELPAFPRLAIHGHAGFVRLGRVPGGNGPAVSGPEVMVLMGRQHAYEHDDAAAMRGAVQTVAAMGCRAIVLTNAAGGINPALRTGDLMVLSDHLNIAQRSPLVGVTDGSRFVDLSAAYDPGLRQQALAAARQALPPGGAAVHEGVYAWVLGPQFETPAEIRMLRTLGADAVGMSTVPEAITARHAGLKVLGLSLITNLAAGLSPVALSHEQTLAAAAEHERGAQQAMLALLAALRP